MSWTASAPSSMSTSVLRREWACVGAVAGAWSRGTDFRGMKVKREVHTALVLPSALSLSRPARLPPRPRHLVDPWLSRGPEAHGADCPPGSGRGGLKPHVPVSGPCHPYWLRTSGASPPGGRFVRWGPWLSVSRQMRTEELYSLRFCFRLRRTFLRQVRMMLVGSKMPCFREGADFVLSTLQDRREGMPWAQQRMGGVFVWGASEGGGSGVKSSPSF